MNQENRDLFAVMHLHECHDMRDLLCIHVFCVINKPFDFFTFMCAAVHINNQ